MPADDGELATAGTGRRPPPPGGWPAPPPGGGPAAPPQARYTPPVQQPWLPGGPPVGRTGWGPTGPGHAGPGGFGQPLPQLAAAHKPGAIPLRPLRLGDMYDGAFKIIRRNPGATVGSATLVTAVALAIPVLVVGVLTRLIDMSALAESTVDGSGTTTVTADPFTTAEVTGLLVGLGSFVLGLVLQALGTVLVTGMIAQVTLSAALGHRLTLAQAWTATHGKRWRLVALAGLLGTAMLVVLVAYGLTWLPVVMLGEVVVAVLYALVTLPLLLVAMLWFYVRVQYYAVPALMLEPVGIFGAVRRSLLLSRRQFWRTLGISLLTAMITGVAGSMLSTPLSLGGQLLTVLVDSPEAALLIMLAVFAASSTVQYAFTTPFASTVSALQYLDQRMRKEAYDVELVARTGGLAP